MTEDRFIDIETKLAHQEHTIAELNDVITNHQEKIMQLEELCASLLDRVRSIGEAMPGNAPQDEKPPHY
jgi:SlyX protein